jgi:hypothetical protein
MDYSLIDEGENHYMVQDNASGQQLAIAKDELSDNLKKQLVGLPKPPTSQEKSVVPEVAPEVTPTPVPMTTPTQEQTKLSPEVMTGLQESAEPTPVSEPQAPKLHPIVAAALSGQDVVIQKDPYNVALSNLDSYQKKMSDLTMGIASAQANGQRDVVAKNTELLNALNQERQSYQQNWNDLTQKTDKLREDVANQKVDPSQFWKQKTGLAGFGSKVSAILGMVLGGVSQMKTGVNPAVQLIQKAIDENIDAQKANLDTKKGLLSDYYRQFGNLEAAHRATTLDMMNMFNAQIAQIGANTQSQTVKQQAAQANLELGRKIDELKGTMAAQKAQQDAINRLYSGEPGTPSEPTGNDIAMLPKEIQEKAVKLPNGKWAVAQTPKVAEDLRELQPEVENMRGIIKEMRSYQGDNPRELTSIIPFVESDKESRAKAMQERAKQTFRNIMTRAGRPGEFTDRAMEKLIPNPSALDQGEVTEKLDQLAAMIENTATNAYQSRLVGSQGSGSKKFKPGL